ncbi:hypothetical protein KVF89_26185 [Nocardioides carbamazepini]|uniref:hypothetical protein n=1 Tax=Nocardioides carbamazepini TaxID=2854259 RepID=UPI00214A8128|nr:hypothetical protein [Nocardioides carbamazepini]MCR1786051.1 hypothetical protein [Nocardioides carbamazepini]
METNTDRRLNRRLSAWGLAALVTTSLTACGTGVSDGPQATSNSASAAEVHAEAQRVYESFAGTQDQHDAAYVLQTYARNGPLDACLEQRGYPEWDWSLSRPYSAPYDALRPSIWFAEIGDRVYSENEIATRPYSEAEKVMNSDEPRPADYEQAIRGCEASTKPASDDEVERGSHPAGASALIEAWRTVLREAGAELGGDPAAYDDCMAAADLPVLEKNSATYDDLAPVMAGEAGKVGPPPAPGQDPGTYTDAWQHLLELEDQVLAADTTCRTDVHDREISNLMPLITEFAEEHAEDIAIAHQGWYEIVARAVQLGYHGQDGPLGK